MVMIGDGATDLEARQPGGADLFIGCVSATTACCASSYAESWMLMPCCARILERTSGCTRCRYGGTVVRENVVAGADWFVYDINAVLDALQ